MQVWDMHASARTAYMLHDNVKMDRLCVNVVVPPKKHRRQMGRDIASPLVFHAGCVICYVDDRVPRGIPPGWLRMV